MIDDGVEVIVLVLSLLLEEEVVFVIVMTVKFTSVMTIKVMMIVKMVLNMVMSWHWQYGDNDGRHDIGDGEISIICSAGGSRGSSDDNCGDGIGDSYDSGVGSGDNVDDDSESSHSDGDGCSRVCDSDDDDTGGGQSGRYGVGADNDGRAVTGNNAKMMVEGVLVEAAMVVMMVKVEVAFMMVKSQ